MAAIGHPYRYLSVINLMAQNEDDALPLLAFARAIIGIPLSRASESYVRFASLPKQTVATWETLIEAFVARFHHDTVQVTEEQVEATRSRSL